MKDFTVILKGETQHEIESALEEVLKLVKEGYLSGVNSNDTGEYWFHSTGEYTG